MFCWIEVSRGKNGYHMSKCDKQVTHKICYSFFFYYSLLFNRQRYILVSFKVTFIHYLFLHNIKENILQKLQRIRRLIQCSKVFSFGKVDYSEKRNNEGRTGLFVAADNDLKGS